MCSTTYCFKVICWHSCLVCHHSNRTMFYRPQHNIHSVTNYQLLIDLWSELGIEIASLNPLRWKGLLHIGSSVNKSLPFPIHSDHFQPTCACSKSKNKWLRNCMPRNGLCPSVKFNISGCVHWQMGSILDLLVCATVSVQHTSWRKS